MKKLLLLVLVFVSLNSFGQGEPIIGTWKFTMNKKIDYPAMMDTASAFGYDISTVDRRSTLFAAVAAVVISRCEDSKIFFSPYKNEVMLTTTRYEDKSIEDVQWGKWSRISKNKYLVIFKNRKELYELNEISGNFYLIEPQHNLGIITKILSNNLMLVRGDN